MGVQGALSFHFGLDYNEAEYKFAPIAGGLDLFMKGMILGLSEDPVLPNYCMSEYPKFYEIALLFNNFLDYY